MSGKLAIVTLADTISFGRKADQNTNDDLQSFIEQRHSKGALKVLGW